MNCNYNEVVNVFTEHDWCTMDEADCRFNAKTEKMGEQHTGNGDVSES